MTNNVALLDTGARSTNLGDEIVVASLVRAVPSMKQATRLPTHVWWRPGDVAAASRQSAAVLAGTNLLGSTMWRHRQWKLTPLDMLALRRKVVLVGVGWGNPGPPLDALSRKQLEVVLHPDFAIGVRDRHTERQVVASGFAAEYVACPTLWGLDASLPVRGSETEVVTTLTDYRPDPTLDRLLLLGLREQFSCVLVWPQGARDQNYLASLEVPSVDLLPRRLGAFEDALRGRAYVGTRLHGGIRALQLGAPTLIVGVDNRARDMAADTDLPLLERDDVPQKLTAALARMGDSKTLRLPTEVIARWQSKLADLTGT